MGFCISLSVGYDTVWRGLCKRNEDNTLQIVCNLLSSRPRQY